MSTPVFCQNPIVSEPFPRPLLDEKGREIGAVLALTNGADENITPIEIDPKILIEVPDGENPNHMSERDFSSLVQEMEKHGFSQPPDVYYREGMWHIIDGKYRRRAANLLQLKRIPASWRRSMRPGEEKVLRLALNAHRGTLKKDVAQQIIHDVALMGWAPEELVVTGFTVEQIQAMMLAAPTQESLDGLLAGDVPAPALPDEQPEKEPRAGSVEIVFSSGENLKKWKKAVARYAKQAGAKGEFKTEAAVMLMLAQLEAN